MPGEHPSGPRGPLLWIALTLLLMTFLGMGGVITYLLVSKDDSEAEISQPRRGKSKLPPALSKAFNKGFNPDYEDEDDENRPTPPSVKAKESPLADIDDDNMRIIHSRISAIRKELRILDRNKARLEEAINEIEDVLLDVSDINDYNRRTRRDSRKTDRSEKRTSRGGSRNTRRR